MKHRIVSFEELIAPLSQGKVMLVVECLSIEGCEQPGIMDDLSRILNLGVGAEYDDWEDFLDFGFVVKEGENKLEDLTEATLLIEYLSNEKFQSVIQADLFVDGILHASSWTGNTEAWGMTDNIPKSAKSVVIRFPVEKIKRRKDTDFKN